MTDRLYRVYISVAPAPGEPRVETLLPALLKLGIVPVWPERRLGWGERKSLIDGCDYLMLFSGHTYIARPPSGVSWQHRELNHAVIRRIPVFSGLLADEMLDTSVQDEVMARLLSFRSQFEGRTSMVWSERKDIPSLLKSTWPVFIKRYPASGWVRAGSVSAVPVFEEKTQDAPAPVIQPDTRREDEESIDMDLEGWLYTQELFSFRCHIYIGGNCQVVEQNLPLTWADVCEAFVTQISPKASEDRIMRELSELLEERFTESTLAHYTQAHAAADFAFTETSMRKIRLKLRRSGLIRKDTHASTRHSQVWIITPAGKRLSSLSENLAD
ncbi:hypothetical protein [Parendozoicomonas sp. Alg238-R29]|uniref:hypothetical protein n=1 Tax=Parendozoicomonas sp. Alg238-R29 TaxID=2993446 RepID=UPI00248DE590|nr:hypothetical protein [Parendozoicomonas sp. Alg238-R29]